MTKARGPGSRSISRRVFGRCVVPVLRMLASPFFDARYLRGRYFDQSLIGWGWVARSFVVQRVLGYNRHVPWPISPSSTVDDPSRIDFDPNDLQNFMHFGCYFSNVGGGNIHIGSGTVIAPNVGIVTTNHSLTDPTSHEPAEDVSIGDNCWIGMNVVILPGVTLGAHTVVAAGAIVTRSFPEGHCVLIGAPARAKPEGSIGRRAVTGIAS